MGLFIVAKLCYDGGMVKKQQRLEGRDVVTVSLRMGADLHARVKQMSEDEKRSLNAQIVWCVEQCAARWARGVKR